MSTSAPPRPAAPAGTTRPSNAFTSLVAVGVLVVAAGLLMPRLLSLSPVPQGDPPDSADTPFQSAPVTKPKSAAPVPSPLTPPPQTEEAVSLFWVAGKVIFGLAIVSGACIALARWSNRLPPTTSPGVLNPVAKLAVDARCVVHLVNAGGRRLLFGTDAAGVKVVLELPAR